MAGRTPIERYKVPEQPRPLADVVSKASVMVRYRPLDDAYGNFARPTPGPTCSQYTTSRAIESANYMYRYTDAPTAKKQALPFQNRPPTPVSRAGSLPPEPRWSRSRSKDTVHGTSGKARSRYDDGRSRSPWREPEGEQGSSGPACRTRSPHGKRSPSPSSSLGRSGHMMYSGSVHQPSLTATAGSSDAYRERPAGHQTRDRLAWDGLPDLVSRYFVKREETPPRGRQAR